MEVVSHGESHLMGGKHVQTDKLLSVLLGAYSLLDLTVGLVLSTGRTRLGKPLYLLPEWTTIWSFEQSPCLGHTDPHLEPGLSTFKSVFVHQVDIWVLLNQVSFLTGKLSWVKRWRRALLWGSLSLHLGRSLSTLGFLRDYALVLAHHFIDSPGCRLHLLLGRSLRLMTHRPSLVLLWLK